MSTIVRPTKIGLTNQYTSEVALGHTTIRAAEVDADLNTIYADYNGNISNVNLAPGANIDGAKFKDASIPGGKLVSHTVTREQIADGSIDTTALANLAVTGAKIAAQTITNVKMGINSVFRVLTVGAVAPSLAITTVETAITTFATVAFGGGVVVIGGWWNLHAIVSLPFANSTRRVILRIRRNGTEVFRVNMNVQPWMPVGTGAASNGAVPIPAPLFFDANPQSGSQTYTITGQTEWTAGDAIALATDATYTGQCFLMELC